MSIILRTGSIFRPLAYETEANFESDVIKISDYIFGSTSIYIDVKKRMGNEIVTIPDGYVIAAPGRLDRRIRGEVDVSVLGVASEYWRAAAHRLDQRAA